MKIILAFPSNLSDSEDKAQINPPVGILFVAAKLEQEGHEVQFYDCMLEGIKLNGFKDILIKEKPDWVGLGFVSTLRAEGFKYAKAAREALPNAKIVVGGVHSTIFPRKILEKFPFIDYVISNEAEGPFAELIEKGPEEVLGVAYRKDGKIIKNAPSIPEPNLDNLPKPSWHLCNMKLYYKKARDFGADFVKFPHFGIITSRGCPSRCTFCGSEKLSRKVRRHSPQYVYDMIKELHVKYGVNDIYFLDDTFAVKNMEWLQEFKKLLQENPLSVVYSGQIRANTPPDILKVLKEIGFYSLNIGVETGSQRILNAMRKGIVVKQIHGCIKAAKKLGLLVKVYLIFCDIHETTEDIKQTVELVVNLPIDEFVWGRMTFFPGTELCVMRGIPNEWWFNNDYMPLSENFDSKVVNHAWFLMCVNRFFQQLRYKHKLGRVHWTKGIIRQLIIVGGLGIFINKIPFKTSFKKDFLAYLFLPLGIVMTKTGLNLWIRKTYLRLRYKREDSIYFDDDKNIIQEIPTPQIS